METSSDSGRESEGDVRAMKTRKVVITGGCGLLGRHVARMLYLEWDCVEIVLFDKTMATSETFQFITQGGPNGHRMHYDPVHRDILNKEHLRHAFQQATVVIHCADMTGGRGWFQQRKMWQFNVEGTRNVVEICRECGVDALVYCRHLGGAAMEEGVPISAYARSKARGEKLVLAANNTLNDDGKTLYTCSLCLPSLYGCYDTRLIPSAILAARRLRGRHLVPSTGLCLAAYAGNGAWGVVCAAQKLLDCTGRSCVGGRSYYITDDTPSSSTEFYRHFLLPFDHSVIPLRPSLSLVLKVILSVMAAVILLYDVLFNVNMETNTVIYYHRLFGNVSNSVSRKDSELDLGYTPRYSFDTAKAISLRFYLSNYY